MSRSKSPEEMREESGARDRRLSVASNHSRPSMDQDEVPAKRARADTRNEDRARGKRLFGNILGTLKQFKKDDKTSRGSEAAKRREQVSERIASKIRTEHALQHDIMGAEKSYRDLRISTDVLEQNIKHKELALHARHSSMKPASRFLHTSLPPSAPPLFEGGLLNPSPIPLNQGPPKEPHPRALRPLFFLPKKLLPEQQTELDTLIANIDELINDETEAFTKEKANALERIKKNRAEITELHGKLAELKKNVKPLEIRGRAEMEQTDELGREKRRESISMEVEGEGEGPEEVKGGTEDRQKEAALQIRGENGDVEVEY